MTGFLAAIAAWIDRNEHRINRVFFWFSAMAVALLVAVAVWCATDGFWVSVAVCALSAFFHLVLALSALDDVRYYRRRHGLPPHPAWVARVHHWVHVALWGWS